jgi:hypothetical protein
MGFEKMLNTVKKSQDLYKNRPWLTFLELVTLGTVSLAVCALLLGCGSDSKPGAVDAKKEKTAASSKTMKSQAVVPLQNLGAAGGANVKREPLAPETVLAPGLTVRQLEEKMEANRKRVEAPDYVVAPGITKKELDDKITAGQKRQESANPANREILPGITKQDLDARMAAHLNRTASSNEGLSGITKQELNTRVEEDRIKRQLNHEVLPGVFKDKLDANLREAGKQ